MDLYFIVAELELPSATAAAWRAGPIPRTKRSAQDTTLDLVLENVEGPVRLEVREGRISLRAFLIDAAYFVVKDELEAALAHAVTLGARGQWYSGDQVSGAWVVAGGKPARAKVHELPVEVRAWIAEAHALDTPPPEPRAKADLPRKTKPKAKARPKTKPKTRPRR